MALRIFPFQSPPYLLNSKHLNLRISISPKTRPPIIRASATPARDRIIDFGKHKGKMLGAIPSTYLKWVTLNIKSEWANLANQVLKDPVYQDRIEWEFADNILSGERRSANLNGAEELHDIADRFGWDFDDKDGWRKVKFPLLGTSESGRLPRVSDRRSDVEETKTTKVARDLAGEERRRRDRVERRRTEREIGKLEREVGTESNGGDDDDRRDRTVEKIRNPFPGREAFLRKVKDRYNF